MCARDDRRPGAGGTPPGPTPSDASKVLLLRVQSTGGFIAPLALYQRYPTFSLYADGTVITEGAQIDIYPQPALPPLLATHISDAGVQAILRAAEQAGLTVPDVTYHGAVMPDAPDTVFTLSVNGHTHRITVTALGSQSRPGMSTAEIHARTALASLSSKLMDLRSWLPAGSVGQDQPYVPTAMDVFVKDGAPKDPGGTLHEPDIAWPLATPLASLGGPLPTQLSGGPTRCGVVDGADLKLLWPKAERANQLSPWVSEGQRFGLSFRPLLPDELGC